MKITRAQVSKLHGVFNASVQFFDDYTFLHGINGTGKTSILKAIQALTLPQLDWLTLNDFSSIEVGIKHNDEKITFRCEKKDVEVTFKYRVGNNRQVEKFNTTRVDNILKNLQRNYGSIESNSESIKTAIFDIFSESEIVKALQRLPSPIFLGLDRTAKLERETDRVLYERRRRLSSPVSMFQDKSLSQGLSQALDLIHIAARRYNIVKRNFENKLREDISFLMFSQQSTNESHVAELPTNRDVTRYRRMRLEITKTLEQIGFDRNRIKENIDTFFSSLIQNAKTLTAFSSFEDAIEKTSDFSAERSHLYGWLSTQPVLSLIFRYFELVQVYNRNVERSRANMSRFESILNAFFSDSGKVVSINDVGEVSVKRGDAPMQVQDLSSGEKQVFVLMTHLVFNPSLYKENILIIDEPELSLHVRWQEIFVDSVMNANPNTQMILATHSPSIVLDRRERMVDLNAA